MSVIELTHFLNGEETHHTTHRISSATGLQRAISTNRREGTHGGVRVSRAALDLPGVTELIDESIQLPDGSTYLLMDPRPAHRPHHPSPETPQCPRQSASQ